MCALSPCRYGIAAAGPESTRKQEGLATLLVMGWPRRRTRVMSPNSSGHHGGAPHGHAGACTEHAATAMGSGARHRDGWGDTMSPTGALPAASAPCAAVSELCCHLSHLWAVQKFQIFQSNVFVAVNCFALANFVILGAACLHPWARHVRPSPRKHLARPRPSPLFPHLHSQ